MLTSVMRALLALTFVALLACSSGTVNLDAGADAHADIYVPPLPGDTGADAPTQCGNVDVSGYQPTTMQPPNAPHAGKCTSQQASDYAQCQGAKNNNLCGQFADGMPGQTCRQCVETQSTDTRWGVLVFTGSNGVFNTEGCVDDVLADVALEKANGGAGSCGDLLSALYGCEDYECNACTGSAYDSCVASISQCNAFETPVDSATGPCAVLFGDAAPSDVHACFPNPQISDPTQQEVDWIDRMVTYMCGQ